MSNWTDDPATTSTHIRVLHITELRRTVEFFRAKAGLPTVTWTDDPVTSGTHIRAVHFTELRSAIQDLWTYHGQGSLPNWSVGSAPSPSRQISARDMNDLRSWINTIDPPPLGIWTGFHWCNPLSQSSNATAKALLQSTGRWAATLLLDPSVGSAFEDACDQIMAARNAVGGGSSLDQSVVRLYWGQPCEPNLGDVSSVQAADAWLSGKGYYPHLDYFVSHGGRNVIVFNELNIDGSGALCNGSCSAPGAEPQAKIDPRVLGYLSYALQNRYYNGGNRQLYTLFPGPSGLLPLDGTAWCNGFRNYFAMYDLWSNPQQSSPQTFSQAYGSGVDSLLANRTMLWHSGSGVFDRVALHCYEEDLTRYSSSDPNTNRALQYLSWMINDVDGTGYIYVTETAGNPQCNNAPSCNCGDYAAAGSALADFTLNANNLFNQPAPNLLRAIYGYILQPSNCDANSQGWHAIDNTFLSGYLAEKQALFP